MHVQNLFRLAALTAFCAAYLLSFHLPEWTSYENGPIEMTQNLVLFAGGLQAVSYGYRARTPWRYLWLAITPIWFICLGRELSWGRFHCLRSNFRPAALSTPAPFCLTKTSSRRSSVCYLCFRLGCFFGSSSGPFACLRPNPGSYRC